MYFKEYESPVGIMRMVSDGNAIIRLVFANHGDNSTAYNVDNLYNYQISDNTNAYCADSIFSRTAIQLDEYFAGVRKLFDVPIAPHGSSFQQAVWTELLKVDYGSTASYGEIAVRCEKSLGHRTSPRAIGGAVGRNPIAIIVPCHRILGVDGSLTGFAAGLEIKKYLLDIEGIAYNF